MNALSYKYSEHLNPLIINSQHQLRNKLRETGHLRQAHFERLREELGRNPRMEDLFEVNFQLNTSANLFKISEEEKKTESEIKLQDLTTQVNNLVTVPLDMAESRQQLIDSLSSVELSDRSVFHSRRLLSIYLYTQTSHQGKYLIFKSLRELFATNKVGRSF